MKLLLPAAVALAIFMAIGGFLNDRKTPRPAWETTPYCGGYRNKTPQDIAERDRAFIRGECWWKQ